LLTKRRARPAVDAHRAVNSTELDVGSTPRSWAKLQASSVRSYSSVQLAVPASAGSIANGPTHPALIEVAALGDWCDRSRRKDGGPARARARLDLLAPAADDVTEPTEPIARALLDGYIAAFENADAAALEHILREDAVLEMTGTRTWFAGLKTCMPFLASHALFSPGDWRMVPTRANGQPAAVAYLRGSDSAHHAYGVAVLTVTTTGTARISVFGDPGLVTKFGYPVLAPAR
jgi:hypothetical protein